MTVTINGEKEQLNQENLNVINLLKIKKVELPDMVSVQINGDFLERNEFDTKQVHDGDEIEFLYFMGGGQ